MKASDSYKRDVNLRKQEIYRYTYELQKQYGLNELSKLIYGNRYTEKDLLGSSLYTKSILHDGHEYATFGSRPD